VYVSESSTNAQTSVKKRKLTDPLDLMKMTPNPNAAALAPSASLLEGYKKHAAELVSIEDRQYKLTLLMLGIFSAGATLIASGHVEMSRPLRVALTVFSLAIVGPSFHYNAELHRLRGVTRELLVRCEIALGFHDKDRFLKNESLYDESEIGYGWKGRWLNSSYSWTVGTVCAAFILVVWVAKFKCTP
jgi:hypothetical protein